MIVIPARRNSSFKHKNFFPLSGRPLIFYTFDAALDVNFNATIFVSTDDPTIEAHARTYNPRLIHHPRPDSLSGPDVTLDQLMTHFAASMINKISPDKYDAYICLPPTSPLRTAEDLNNAVAQFELSGADSLLSVVPEHKSIWIRSSVDWATPIIDRTKNRQYSELAYVANGAIFITKQETLLQLKRRTGGRTGLFIMLPRSSVDITDREDIRLAEHYLDKQEPIYP